MLKAHSAMSVMVALTYTDLLAILSRQWNEFPLTRGALQRINIRAGLPLTPVAEHFCDLLRRY